MISDTATKAIAPCIQAIREAEAALIAAQPTPVSVVAAATPGALGHLVEVLKPGILTLDASPIKLTQWKRKLVTYLRRLGVPNLVNITDQHSIFFGCMESAVADRVMHHDQYDDQAMVLLVEPVPTSNSLVELLNEVYLEVVPLFNWRLEFFQMRQRTGEGETVKQFVEMLEARAREAEVNLMAGKT